MANATDTMTAAEAAQMVLDNYSNRLDDDLVAQLRELASSGAEKAEGASATRLAKALTRLPSRPALSVIAKAERDGGGKLAKRLGEVRDEIEDAYLAAMSPQAHAAASRRG
jgi:hypothetical protein